MVGLAGNRRQQAERKRVQRVAMCAQRVSVSVCVCVCEWSPGAGDTRTYTESQTYICSMHVQRAATVALWLLKYYYKWQ